MKNPIQDSIWFFRVLLSSYQTPKEYLSVSNSSNVYIHFLELTSLCSSEICWCRKTSNDDIKTLDSFFGTSEVFLDIFPLLGFFNTFDNNNSVATRCQQVLLKIDPFLHLCLYWNATPGWNWSFLNFCLPCPPWTEYCVWSKSMKTRW